MSTWYDTYCCTEGETPEYPICEICDREIEPDDNSQEYFYWHKKCAEQKEEADHEADEKPNITGDIPQILKDVFKSFGEQFPKKN